MTKCGQYLHRRTGTGVCHFSFSTGKAVGPCVKSGKQRSGDADLERQQWEKESRKQWLVGDDVRIGFKRRRFVRSGKSARSVRREHAFKEGCDCVCCVSKAKDIEAIRESSEHFRGVG